LLEEKKKLDHGKEIILLIMWRRLAYLLLFDSHGNSLISIANKNQEMHQINGVHQNG
jgi:hypothetical protein